MGQTHASGTFFVSVSVKDHFSAIQTLWGEEDLTSLPNRLKEMTLNFSLDRMKFAKLLQLATQYDALVSKWFEEFSHDRASQVVDGLEFLSASIMIASNLPLFRKVCLLFTLFDLDKTGYIRKDEFTIFLKAVTTGLNRMCNGLPPPATVMELGILSSEFFGTLSSQKLSERDLLMWMTEAHYSVHYLSVLSRLGAAVFAWGTNQRFQLGLNLEPEVQRVPAPLLTLEGIRIKSVASYESHSLFLTEDGRVFSCGSGFCGILGHGGTQNVATPKLIDALAHAIVIDVAVGVRHSVAVSDKGQVFTWGSSDLGQLGHGKSDDREVHEAAYDPTTGGQYTFVSKPTVVMGLYGKKCYATNASCCNFSTVVLTDQGHLYSWGNNTDGQCGHPQKCNDHNLIYVDPHMHRTAMQALVVPRKVETNAIFKAISCGGYHGIAIDNEDRVWTWGQGLWGKLGHGDQRSMFEPTLVQTLRYHVTKDIAAGEVHSTCLTSLYRMTITGSSASVPLSPFSILGLPAGRPDRHAASRDLVTPPTTSLQLNAFVSAPLYQLGLPFRHEPDLPILGPEHSQADVQNSVVLMDRALWEGEWLKLATTDFDFKVKISSSGAALPSRMGVTGRVMYAAEGRWEPDQDCPDRICVLELALRTDKVLPEELTPLILQLAGECLRGQGLACLFVLPKKVELFDVVAPADTATAFGGFLFGVLSHEHGAALKKHTTRLINLRIQESPDNIPEDVKDWREAREEFTGKTYFENVVTGQKRWAPPQIDPNTEGSLLVIKEDYFLQRLKAVLDCRPMGIIVCQQSWRPDVELLMLPESMFDLEKLCVPIVVVTYEAGEELKSIISKGSVPFVTMEIQETGGLCSWGNGSKGQLGLSGIENQNFLTQQRNALTGEENSYVHRPYYVAHLHEHQVTSIACGASHSVAVTQQGEVFTWGKAAGLGVCPWQKPCSEVPLFVEQLEGLVKATKAFAGADHSLVVAEMPFKSIV